MKPLEGIRILDLGQVIAIPYGTQWMSWLGADVILVESERHLTSRVTPPFVNDQPHPDASGSFNLLNGGKRSITVDLGTEEGREIILDLAREVDVVLDNFGPGVLDRLRLNYDFLKEINPQIVMLSLGAFGREGPMSDLPGYHSAVNLFSGMADATGYKDGHPRIMGGVLPDPLSGVYSVFAVLAALRYRRLTGQGQFIDGAMHEVLLTLIPQAVMDLTMNGREPERVGNRDWNNRVAPQGIYRCQGDDAWIAIEIHTLEQWQTLCGVISRPEWAESEAFATIAGRMARHDEIDDAIQQWTRNVTAPAAVDQLQSFDLPAGPVAGPHQLIEDPQLRHRGFFVTTEHSVGGVKEQPGLPWVGDTNEEVVYRPAPLLGEHTLEILKDVLGFDAGKIRELSDAGVLK